MTVTIIVLWSQIKRIIGPQASDPIADNIWKASFRKYFWVYGILNAIQSLLGYFELMWNFVGLNTFSGIFEVRRWIYANTIKSNKKKIIKVWKVEWVHVGTWIGLFLGFQIIICLLNIFIRCTHLIEIHILCATTTINQRSGCYFNDWSQIKITKSIEHLSIIWRIQE